MKAVHIARKGHTLIKLIEVGIAEIQKSSENPTNARISAIQTVLDSCNFTKGNVVTSVGGSSVVIKQVTFPTMSPKEIDSSLKWEAGQYIPLPGDEAEIKFQIRTADKVENRSEVLLVAVKKESLKDHLNLIRHFDFQPRIVDATPLALANAFLNSTANHEDKNIVLVEIGAGATVITIFRKGGFFLTRDISIGGDRFTGEVQAVYNLPYSEAEKAKKEKGFDLDLVKSVLDQLLLELRQSLLYYDTRTGNKGYHEIVVTGGGSRLTGLDSYLEDKFRIPVVDFNPFSAITGEDNSPENLQALAPQLGVAMGLALRG
ncbi:MAG: type IV pilus assembly protein PilM [Deltaproteobacteria bacterium]|nr:type IV pilus assembly protein PilM [Deltaproteobacteria bacterium]